MSDVEQTNISEHKARTVSLKVPKIKLPSVQSGILILLIVVGLLQTIQILGLDKQIASASIGSSSVTSTTTPSSSSSGSSVTSSLPEMVGGC